MTITSVEAMQEVRSELRDAQGKSWSGMRVTVVGLGASGISAARLLRRAGCIVNVTDESCTPALEERAKSLLAEGIEKVELGRHSQDLIDSADLVVASPGVSDSAPPLMWAHAKDKDVISDIELGARFCSSLIVAVTGTNGKSSVVTMIREVLGASGREAIACGNLGLPFCSVIEGLKFQTVVVLEVSSFQLSRCFTFHPKIAVLLNLGTNHLDHHKSRQEYLAAKSRLFNQQNCDDWAVLNGGDSDVIALSGNLRARHAWFGDNRTNTEQMWISPQTQQVFEENFQAVLQVGRLLDIPDPLISQVIRSFRGLEHRLERVGTFNSIAFINDSKSTTPESFLFALNKITGPVIAILGGRDKGLDFGPLTGASNGSKVKAFILIGESRGRLRKALPDDAKVHESLTLEAALQDALKLALAGDTVLFSPACASFDMFENFEARGRAFKALVSKLAYRDKDAENGAWESARFPRPETGIPLRE